MSSLILTLCILNTVDKCDILRELWKHLIESSTHVTSVCWKTACNIADSKYIGIILAFVNGS